MVKLINLEKCPKLLATYLDKHNCEMAKELRALAKARLEEGHSVKDVIWNFNGDNIAFIHALPLSVIRQSRCPCACKETIEICISELRGNKKFPGCPVIDEMLSLITRSFTLAILPAFQYLVNSIIALLRILFPERLGMVELQTRFYFLGALTLAIFVSILALGLLSRRFWCRNLCPLGALLGLFSRLSLLRRRTENACSKCNRCVRECSMASLEEPSEYHKE